MKELYQKARKHYIHFLKMTSVNHPSFDNAPANLLELLDNAYSRKMKIKSMMNEVQ